MTRRRIHKISEAVRQVVSTAILTDLWDPRVKNITVTKVGISGDMRRATIHISVMGSDKEQELSLRGLRHSKGFLQSKIAENSPYVTLRSSRSNLTKESNAVLKCLSYSIKWMPNAVVTSVP